jgi:hypothetical protein
MVVALLSVLSSVAWSPLGAQAARKQTGVQACSLLTDAEVKQLVARGSEYALEKNEASYGTGSVCTYGTGRGQIMVFVDPNAEANFNSLLQSYHKEMEAKHPVSGVGNGAYVMYPKPRDEYEVRVGLLATKVRQYMLAITLEPDRGKPSDSVEPALIALTKVVMQKLP